MNSILRTITTSLIPRTVSVTKVMDSSSSGGSQRLLALAQHLRLYKPPPPFPEDVLEQSIEESGGKVVSQLGFPESATMIQNPDKFSPKKAAVLICLFEGDDGDLRVILTKRSSKLSTHSGIAFSNLA
jgi:peroxisomal coenzyme A diphosphatase NUDT7